MAINTIPAPKSVEETGVRRNMLEDLALKILYMAGELTIQELARKMSLGHRIVDDLFQRLRKEQLCQVTGVDRGVHYCLTTTSGGKSRALDLLAQNQYVGPAPVSFDDYVYRVGEQGLRNLKVTPSQLHRACEDLVLDPKLLDQLGTAVVSGRGLFLYGPTGTGKSTIAEALTRLFDEDRIWLPYAVEIDGQIITVYDGILHRKLEVQPEGYEQDARWLICQRPRVMVGGELTVEMLDLQFNPGTKFYSGPLQMKANNGMLIIDDFGRQRVSPEELLNRWVVPLDRRIDFLTLSGGKKIEIPFDLFVVFATNLDPGTMMDEAFLRRIQTKIKVDFVTADQFHEISRRACVKSGLTYNASVVGELIKMIGFEYKEPLRACYPRDILQQILWSARYQQGQPNLDRESVTEACRNYFLTR